MGGLFFVVVVVAFFLPFVVVAGGDGGGGGGDGGGGGSGGGGSFVFCCCCAFNCLFVVVVAFNCLFVLLLLLSLLLLCVCVCGGGGDSSVSRCQCKKRAAVNTVVDLIKRTGALAEPGNCFVIVVVGSPKRDCSPSESKKRFLIDSESRLLYNEVHAAIALGFSQIVLSSYVICSSIAESKYGTDSELSENRK